MSEFDAYHKWLGITPEEQPPNHYKLLGIHLFESDPDVIEAAADRQMSHLQSYKNGEHAQLSQTILNEMSAAKISLLNVSKKEKYDEELKAEIAHAAPPPPKARLAAKPTEKIPEEPSIEIQGSTADVSSYINTRQSTDMPSWFYPVLGVGALVVGIVGWVMFSGGDTEEVVENQSKVNSVSNTVTPPAKDNSTTIKTQPNRKPPKNNSNNSSSGGNSLADAFSNPRPADPKKEPITTPPVQPNSTQSIWAKDPTRGGVLRLKGNHSLEATGYQGIAGAAERTVCGWIRTEDGTGDNTVLYWGEKSGGKRWDFRLNGSGQLQAAVSGGYATGSTNLRTGAWVHIAAVLPAGATNVSQTILYVNGQLETLSSTRSNIVNTTLKDPTTIGSLKNTNHFNGDLDDLRVYSRALSASEIADLAAGKAVSNKNLEAQWEFDEPSGVTAADSSGNSRDATLAE